MSAVAAVVVVAFALVLIAFTGVVFARPAVAERLVSGAARLPLGPRREVPAGAQFIFPVELVDWHAGEVRLRLVQSGRVGRTYDFAIRETP